MRYENIRKYLREDSQDAERQLAVAAFIQKEVKAKRGYEVHEKGNVGDNPIFMLEKNGQYALLGVVIEWSTDTEGDAPVGLDGKDLPVSKAAQMEFSIESLCEQELVMGMVARVVVSRDFESDPEGVNFYKIQRVEWSLV